MMTGDASVNAKAPIICCTAEILASIALRDGADADVGQVVMDEFHYYADPDRGWAWQVPLIELPKAQFILMSATLGDVTRFQEDLTKRTGWPTAVVKNAERPVPLVFAFSLAAAARDAERAAHHQPGPRLYRAFHPGGRARAGPGADVDECVHAARKKTRSRS